MKYKIVFTFLYLICNPLSTVQGYRNSLQNATPGRQGIAGPPFPISEKMIVEYEEVFKKFSSGQQFDNEDLKLMIYLCTLLYNEFSENIGDIKSFIKRNLPHLKEVLEHLKSALLSTNLVVLAVLTTEVLWICYEANKLVTAYNALSEAKNVIENSKVRRSEIEEILKQIETNVDKLVRLLSQSRIENETVLRFADLKTNLQNDLIRVETKIGALEFVIDGKITSVESLQIHARMSSWTLFGVGGTGIAGGAGAVALGLVNPIVGVGIIAASVLSTYVGYKHMDFLIVSEEMLQDLKAELIEIHKLQKCREKIQIRLRDNFQEFLKQQETYAKNSVSNLL